MRLLNNQLNSFNSIGIILIGMMFFTNILMAQTTNPNAGQKTAFMQIAQRCLANTPT